MFYDVAIIGGSLSGSLLANILGKAGHKVLLVDKSCVPGDKPCGEALSMVGLQILQRHELLKDTLTVKPLKGYRMHYGQRQLIIDGEFGVGIRRTDLQLSINDKLASYHSVNRYQGLTVTKVMRDGTAWLLQAGVNRFRSRHLVLASGGDSEIYKQLDLKPTTAPNNKRIGMSCTFQSNADISINHVEIFLQDNYQLLITPISNNKVNLSFLGNKQFTQNEFLEIAATTLKMIGFIGEPASRVQGRIIRHGYKRSAYLGNSLTLVGDACYQFDPIGGMGMTHALLSAEALSVALKSILSGAVSEKTAMTRYRKQQARLAIFYHYFTDLILAILVRYRSLAFACGNISTILAAAVTKIMHTPALTKLVWQ